MTNHLDPDRRPGLGNRLDRIAGEATAGRQLVEPSQSRLGWTTRSRRGAIILGLASVVLLAFLAGVVRTNSDEAVLLSPAETELNGPTEDRTVLPVPPDIEPTLTDDTPLLVDPEPPAIETDCETDGTLGPLLGRLREGVEALDHVPSRSFVDLAERSQVVVAGVIGAVATDEDGLTVLDVAATNIREEDVGDVTVLSYPTGSPAVDELPPGARQTSASFVGFASRTGPGETGGWALAVEGLYVACDLDGRAQDILQNAAGPEDPATPTLRQIIEVTEETVARPLNATPSPFPPTAGPTTTEASPDPADPVQLTPEQVEALSGPASIEATPLPSLTTMPDAGVPETAAPLDPGPIRDALQAFAQGDTSAFDRLPLADDVGLALAGKVVASRTAGTLRDPTAWSIGEGEAFRGREGPFSAFGVMGAAGPTTTGTGPHGRCASDLPVAVPPGFEDHIQQAIEPAADSYTSCIEWFAIDIYRNPDTLVIDVISLDLWEP